MKRLIFSFLAFAAIESTAWAQSSLVSEILRATSLMKFVESWQNLNQSEKEELGLLLKTDLHSAPSWKVWKSFESELSKPLSSLSQWMNLDVDPAKMNHFYNVTLQAGPPRFFLLLAKENCLNEKQIPKLETQTQWTKATKIGAIPAVPKFKEQVDSKCLREITVTLAREEGDHVWLLLLMRTTASQIKELTQTDRLGELSKPLLVAIEKYFVESKGATNFSQRLKLIESLLSGADLERLKALTKLYDFLRAIDDSGVSGLDPCQVLDQFRNESAVLLDQEFEKNCASRIDREVTKNRLKEKQTIELVDWNFPDRSAKGAKKSNRSQKELDNAQAYADELKILYEKSLGFLSQFPVFESSGEWKAWKADIEKQIRGLQLSFLASEFYQRFPKRDRDLDVPGEAAALVIRWKGKGLSAQAPYRYLSFEKQSLQVTSEHLQSLLSAIEEKAPRYASAWLNQLRYQNEICRSIAKELKRRFDR